MSKRRPLKIHIVTDLEGAAMVFRFDQTRVSEPTPAKLEAMRILTGKLLERRLEEREAEQARLKGEHVEAGWGNQIRSYVLHPYTMVKDHRTGVETSNTTAVLNGDIDVFIESYLRSHPPAADAVAAPS